MAKVGKPARLLLDSDIFILNAGVGLLPDLIAAAGFELRDARRLEALPHMLRKGRIPKIYNTAAIEKAEAWCARISAIQRVPDGALLDRLLRIPDIDEGEAYLFALAAESHSVVATGDNRACTALNESGGDIRDKLKGKIIGFEMALVLLLQRLGFPALARALTPAREYNQTLRVLLSQGERTPEEAFKEGLNSYSGNFAKQAGSLLFRR